MDLTLGRRADYAIRAALALARHDGRGGRRKAREIGDEMAIPASYLPQILAQLVRAGLVTSEAGPHGGYALARPGDEVSLLDVIAATEGDPSSTECVLRSGPCRWDDVCAVHVPWSMAQQALLGKLRTTTLADVADIDAALDAGTYEVPESARRTVVGGRPTPS